MYKQHYNAKMEKGHTTPHVCVPLTNPRRNISSEHDQQARFRLQCSVLDSFHTEIQGPVSLSVGPEAKLDMFNNFDLDKMFDLHLDPPSAENPPLYRIIQESKDPILTTNFCLTNVEPKPWILPTTPANNDTTTSTTAAAASNFTPEIQPDPVQPGEIRLHLWMLYTPQAPVLDLRGQNVISTLDLGNTFHQLCLCPTEDKTQGEPSTNGRRKSQKNQEVPINN